jgi:UDP-N-acetyl-D-mannosaminuronic acid transferase (WecB/TagA/CpsF family)
LIPETGIAFCKFGAPYQEIFLNRQKNATPPHLNKEFSNNNSLCYNKKEDISDNHVLQYQRCGGKIGVAMGVGGAFDFVTGKIRRSPVFARKLGLEWLFRLIQQPKRFRRIFNAVIIFSIKIIINNKPHDNQNKVN